jgi:hypothetical protein
MKKLGLVIDKITEEQTRTAHMIQKRSRNNLLIEASQSQNDLVLMTSPL